MVSFLNNFPQVEGEAPKLSPEQKLWRAVFTQAVQDTFGICTVAMSDKEHRECKYWWKNYNQNFIELCEMAGFDPQQTFEKLKRYNLIKSGIIWNYTKNGKRKFADVAVQ